MLGHVGSDHTSASKAAVDMGWEPRVQMMESALS